MSGVGGLLEEARKAGRRLVDELGERASLHERSVQVPEQGVDWETIAQHAQQRSLRQHIWRTRQAVMAEARDMGVPAAVGPRVWEDAGTSSTSSSGSNLMGRAPEGSAAAAAAAGAAAVVAPGAATAAAAQAPTAASSEVTAAAAAAGAKELVSASSQGSSDLEVQEQLAIVAATATMEVARVPVGDSKGWEEGSEAAPAYGSGSGGAGAADDTAADAAALVRRQLAVAAMRGCKPWSLVDGGKAGF